MQLTEYGCRYVAVFHPGRQERALEPVLRFLPLWVLLFNDPIIAAQVTANLELAVDRPNDTPAAGYTFGDFNECHLCVRQ